MKIKDGLLTLVIAAALGSTGVYAQGAASEGVTPGDTSLPDPTQRDQSSSTATPPSSSSSSSASSEMQSESRPETSAAVSPDERARGSEMSSMSHRQAQSDVPPPVDSETVRHVQQALSDQGHKVNVDGIWGDRTHEALKEYQSDKHLNASGQLDGETFAALGLTEGAQQTASASSSQSQSPSSSSSQQGQSGLTQQQQATEEQQAKIESSNEESSPSQ